VAEATAECYVESRQVLLVDIGMRGSEAIQRVRGQMAVELLPLKPCPVPQPRQGSSHDRTVCLKKKWQTRSEGERVGCWVGQAAPHTTGVRLWRTGAERTVTLASERARARD